MPALSSFDYAIVRVVPRVEREEFVNAGAIVFCLECNFLKARVHLDEARLRALWPELDLDLVRRRLEAVERICAGDVDVTAIAKLSRRERFHWLVAPRSTVIQISPVHTGLCESPETALDRVFRESVLPLPGV
ncbi:MAG: DUF3037 domain-containing protein [Acidobacteriota bacterium]|nr:DUF3037 domain-containing protein [Acidobacteriota bacterium]